MRQRIEIESLNPNIDPKTLQLLPGLILCYKDQSGQVRSIQLEGSQKSIMELFNIENLTDVSKRKVDIDFEEKDGKQRISGISMVDDRPLTYVEYMHLKDMIYAMDKEVDEILKWVRTQKPKPPETKTQ